MNKHEKTSENWKNIAIVLLLLSAVFLGWQSRLFGNSSADLAVFADLMEEPVSASDNGTENTTGGNMARPLVIAVTGEDGTHYGLKYQMDELDQVFNKSFQIFTQALGTAQLPSEISVMEWQAALLSPGVCYEYVTPVRLSVLGGWYDTVITESWGALTARRLCVAAVDGENKLFFQDEETGGFYAAATAVTNESISRLIEAYSGSNASFAFERLRTSDIVTPYTLVFPEITAYPLVGVENPLGVRQAQINALQALGINEHQKPVNTSDGSSVYIDSDVRVQLWPDGRIAYTRTALSEPSPMDEQSAIELAFGAVADTIGQTAGDAAVYFDTVTSPNTGAFVVTFKYVVAGGLVYIGQDGLAAAVTVKDGVVQEMDLRYKSYTVLNETVKLMREVQTAAATGGAFRLYYPDGGGDVIEPAWIKTSTAF